MIKNRRLLGVLAVALTTLSLNQLSASRGAGLDSLSHPVARGDLSTQSIYFVMTDRFANGDPTNDSAGLIGADAVLNSGFDPSAPGYYHGGDFKGLTAHLPYIKQLGFTSIWVTPPVAGQYVQQGSADYHGYWGLNFTTVDPHLGTESDFKNFVSTAHSLGLKVILDIVVNHTADVISYVGGDYSYVYSNKSPYKTCAGKTFDPSQYAEKSNFPKLCPNISFPKIPYLPSGLKHAKKPEFLNDVTNYHNRGNTAFDGASNLDGDFSGLDDIFTEKPQVLQGEISLWSSWITKFDIDGFRLDTAQYVNPEFWNKFLPAILKVAHAHGHPNFPIFGEVSNSDASFTSQFVTEQNFPSVLDFPFQAAAQSYVESAGAGKDLAAFFNTDDYYTTVKTSAYGLATFLGNHDMGRIGMHIYNSGVSVGATDGQMLERDELSDAVLFLLRGCPILYYGDEKGMTGTGGDQAARQDMFATQVVDWQSEYRIGGAPIGSESSFDVHNPMEDVITSLQKLYTIYPALKSGTQQVRYGLGNVFAVSRYGNNREFLVAFNDGDDPQTFTSPVSTANSIWTPISGSATDISSTGNSVTLTLPARSWTVLQADQNFVPQQKTLSITLNDPKIDYNTQNWVELSAIVPGNDFETVTFDIKVPGHDWQSAGSSDHRTYAYMDTPGGLFRTYLHPREFKSGTKIQIVAVVKDALGNLAGSAVKNYTIKY
jgi:alpha-amylase